VIFYIDRVDWTNGRGYRVRVPVPGPNRKRKNIHKTFSARKLGISMKDALVLARRERDRAMKQYDIGRPYPKPKTKPKKRLYGVYRYRRRIRGKGSWYWRADWPVGNRIVAVTFSEGAHPLGVARQKAIAARLTAEARYPQLRKSRGYGDAPEATRLKVAHSAQKGGPDPPVRLAR
jgi:hypothetical protein